MTNAERLAAWRAVPENYRDDVLAEMAHRKHQARLAKSRVQTQGAEAARSHAQLEQAYARAIAVLEGGDA